MNYDYRTQKVLVENWFQIENNKRFVESERQKKNKNRSNEWKTMWSLVEPSPASPAEVLKLTFALQINQSCIFSVRRVKEVSNDWDVSYSDTVSLNTKSLEQYKYYKLTYFITPHFPQPGRNMISINFLQRFQPPTSTRSCCSSSCYLVRSR